MCATDPYRILNEDEDDVVGSILKGMMEKELVKDNFLNDLGFDDKRKQSDPTIKMHLRHQQVSDELKLLSLINSVIVLHFIFYFFDIDDNNIQ